MQGIFSCHIHWSKDWEKTVAKQRVSRWHSTVLIQCVQRCIHVFHSWLFFKAKYAGGSDKTTAIVASMLISSYTFLLNAKTNWKINFPKKQDRNTDMVLIFLLYTIFILKTFCNFVFVKSNNFSTWRLCMNDNCWLMKHTDSVVQHHVPDGPSEAAEKDVWQDTSAGHHHHACEYIKVCCSFN